MDIRPILSTLMRHKTAASLIVIEIALTCAIICNALFMISDRIREVREVSGLVEDELVRVQILSIGSDADQSARTRTDLANLLSLANLAESASAISPPMQAVLSAQDVNVKLRAMLRDEQTETVSYPRMVVTNNREVVIRNVENKPVLGGSTEANSGGGATTSSAISYLPIGTVINIPPKPNK